MQLYRCFFLAISAFAVHTEQRVDIRGCGAWWTWSHWGQTMTASFGRRETKRPWRSTRKSLVLHLRQFVGGFGSLGLP